MGEWLTPTIAVGLMVVGVFPSFLSFYLLMDQWRSPGLVWFLVSMMTGGLWAFLFTLMTLVPTVEGTLFVANFFWPVIPMAAVSLFLLAYEFVFKTIVSDRFAAALFAPVVILFVLTWINPADLVFTEAYYVDANGYLHFPLVGGLLRLLVVQVYGYTLVFLAAGMFVGEAMRTTGVHRRQTLYLLLVFMVLVGSTMVKVAGLVPVFYDPTSTVYALSGLLFAYSINRQGLLRFVPVAREQAFEEVDDILLVVDSASRVIDANRAGRQFFGPTILDTPVEHLIGVDDIGPNQSVQSVQLTADGVERDFSLRTTITTYGRQATGRIVVLSDITMLKERERELQLLKEIFSRVFRHNIRNDISLVAGYADLIRESGDEETAEWATHISERANRLLKQSEKARTIEKLIGQQTTERLSLRVAVADAIERVPEPASVEIRTDVADVELDLHPKFSMAIEELIANSIEHQSASTTSTITIKSELTADTCRVVVTDDGPGIPETELRVLEAEEETGLEHSSGLGLWLVRWLVAQSNGEVSGEVTPDGTRITITLPRSDSTGP